jgi:DnaK suppressor protein
MEKAMLDHFCDLLEAELAHLLSKAGVTVAELTGTTSDSEPDPLDRAMQEISRTCVYRIRNRESRLINKIKDRLQAIEDGTYGTCADCEEPITLERLKARPVASYCITCKTFREAYEKVIGF